MSSLRKGVWSSPGAHEKQVWKWNPLSSYQELAQVYLAEKAEAYREKLLEGIRQISLVSSVEEMPTVL